MSKKKKIYKLTQRKSTEFTVKNRNSWTFTLAVLGITGTICFLLITGKVDIDSSTLLSLILAFFSIYLSAQFYFKATEQSNQFYDRSYNHTRDIAKTLSSMEGRFGEGLKNIEQYSTRLNKRFDNLPFINNSLQENVLGEAQKNIQELLEKIEVGEISTDVIKEFEEKFSQLQNENRELKKRLTENKSFKNKKKMTDDYYFDIASDLVKEYSVRNLLDMNNLQFSKKVEEIVFKFYDDSYIDKLVIHGILNNKLGLTAKGAKELKLMIKIFLDR